MDPTQESSKEINELNDTGKYCIFFIAKCDRFGESCNS